MRLTSVRTVGLPFAGFVSLMVLAGSLVVLAEHGEVYPASLNPAADGLRNLTGRVNRDGTVTIWAITSTVSSNGDQGADPNQLVAITDRLAAKTPDREHFRRLRTARHGEVLRGVSFTPGPEGMSCDDRRSYDHRRRNDRGCEEDHDRR